MKEDNHQLDQETIARLLALRDRIESGEVNEGKEQTEKEADIATILFRLNEMRVRFIQAQRTTQTPNSYASLIQRIPFEVKHGEQRTGNKLNLTVDPNADLNLSAIEGDFYLNHGEETSWGFFTISPNVFYGLITTMDRGGRKKIADFSISSQPTLDQPRLHPDIAISAGNLLLGAFEEHILAK